MTISLPRLAARIIPMAALSTLVVLSGCGSGEPVAQAPVTTSTTLSAAALRAALLNLADVPGSKAATDTDEPEVSDYGACFKDHPLGANSHPTELAGPDLEVTERKVERGYSSTIRRGAPEEVRAYVNAVTQPTATTCLNETITTFFKTNSIPATGVTGSVKPLPIADGGALYTSTGSLGAGRSKQRFETHTVVFAKRGMLVTIDAGSFGGPLAPDQTVELARRVAARLP